MKSKGKEKILLQLMVHKQSQLLPTNSKSVQVDFHPLGRYHKDIAINSKHCS
jgi:hypothetical protein